MLCDLCGEETEPQTCDVCFKCVCNRCSGILDEVLVCCNCKPF